MQQIIDITNKLIIHMDARQWCKLPYPNHPKGCPNYGIRLDCPPIIKTLPELFNLNKPHWLAIVDFDIKSHRNKLQKIHPNWSHRQLSCCLYWQGGVRKQLKQLCYNFTSSHPNTTYSTCPEAMGIQIIRTLKEQHIPVSTKIKDTVYKVALIGYPMHQ